ncbi:MAG: transcription repressor NadR [Alicyclobacillus mali]|uniref:transcription repressor NadR n=1 Tax=Alicyclobacillus mali (ex Roth et al. 2021) TaxID=1123961 RepID=UPI0023F4D538|nr:transcription repressor NadR [Alicyclobacillus mali (ex Roth et al. 2021)]MCL6487594.1 transcription repressor NadR [Alicyclobacillus mali (ex Roth et al. 2021)]
MPTERQSRLLDILQRAESPVPGQALAEALGVTRQVVVHDIALLRAAGEPIYATPKGYWLNRPSPARETVIAVSHTPDQTKDELYTLVDHGVRVLDVRVEHVIYGEIVGHLLITSRRDVDVFLEKVRAEKAALLSSLTGGFHYHRVQFDREDQLVEACDALRRAGIQVMTDPSPGEVL